MYDYHTHSSFSEDSSAEMSDMLKAAASAGVRELAVTDHYDPYFPDPVWNFGLDLDSYFIALNENAERFKDKVRLVKGIEIGLQPGKAVQECDRAASAFPYDVVIGSIHTFLGRDLDARDFSDINREMILPKFYENMYECLSRYENYDILGHFNIIDRYIDFVPEYDCVTDIIAEILKLVIKSDKSIELNTSSYRYGMGERTHASSEILSLYRDLGGRNVTMGSDAHYPEHVAWEFGKAREILLAHGFSKLSIYKNRERSETDL